MSFDEIGNVKKRCEEAEVEWEIPDFFSLAENEGVIQCPSFNFAEISWNLQLFPRSTNKFGFMSLYLNTGTMTEISVKYTFGLKKVNGTVEHLEEGIIRENLSGSAACFLKLSEIEERKSELAPTNLLIVVSTLKQITNNSDKSRILDHPKHTEIIQLDTLSKNFKNLFINKCSWDTALHVKDKQYKAHKVVLMARSSVFAAMFLHESKEKLTGIVNISDCEAESFEKFLEFLYCGKLEELSSREALHLYETSDKYDVQDLKTSCVVYLMQNLTIGNVCDFVIIADKYDETDLLSAGQNFFNEHASEIVDTPEWDSLVEKTTAYLKNS